MSDPQHPGAKRSPCRIKGTGLAPDRHEDVLDDLLGGRAVDRLGRQVEDEGRIPAVKRAERLLAAGGELPHQLLVALAPPGRGRGIGRTHAVPRGPAHPQSPHRRRAV
jgi:hypothetical protein